MKQVGDRVTDSSNKIYQIEQYLGESLTSVIYRARREPDGVEVALKLLRPEVSEVIAGNFWEEGEILGALARAAQESGEAVRVPRVVGVQRARGQDRFLALEWVRGTALSRLVEEQGPVPEVQALAIAVQVLGVLHLLHHSLRRTYTDFQLQNIWVTLGSEGAEPQVKVMDWNHVSERVPEQDALPADFGAGDLARFGAYFYRMATGKGAYERGETRRALAQRAGAQWEALSLGTRQILLRALHPDPTRRFASAQAFCKAAQAQLARWRDEDAFHAELNEAVMRLRALPQAGEQDAPLGENEAEWLDAILDVAVRRGYAAQVARYLTRLRQETGAVSVAWRAGEQYYRAGQYHEAVEKWRAEAVALGEVRFHRWVLLAEAGATYRGEFEAGRLPLEEIVTALGQHEPDKALARLQQLPATLTAVPVVESLRLELWAFHKVAEAEEGEQADDEAGWEQAAQAYQEADRVLAKVPYQKLLREEEGWTGLGARAQQLIERLTTHRASSGAAQASRARLASDFEAGRKAIETALRRDPSHAGLIRLCLTEARQRIETAPAQALALAETALLFAHLTPELRAHLVACLNDARLATLKESHENEYTQRKAALEVEYAQRIETLEKEYGARFDLEQAERLLSEGLWADFLHLAPAGDSILTELRRHGWVKKLEATLEDMLRGRDVVQAEALLLVLARLDNKPNAVAARRQKVGAARQQLKNDQYNWQLWVWAHTQALHREQRVSKSVLLAWVTEFLLPLTEHIEAWRQERPKLETLRRRLEEELQAEKGATRAEGAGSAGAGTGVLARQPPPATTPSPVPERREGETLAAYADRVMGAGADAFQDFTFFSLGRAKACFQEAQRLDPNLKLAQPLLAWIKRLMVASPPHARERWGFVQRQASYRDLRESLQANRSTWDADAFLQAASVLSWMEVARQERGHAQSKLYSDSAAVVRHKERAYYLGQLVLAVFVWDGEQVFKGVESPLQAEEIRTFGAGVDQFVKETKAIGLAKKR